MKYTMTKPCPECPFLKGSPLNKTLPKSRLREFASGKFACHKTAELQEDEDGHGQYVGKAESQHCAGALIALEKAGAPHQMMRIAGRLGMYDPTKLDMASDVVSLRGQR